MPPALVQVAVSSPIDRPRSVDSQPQLLLNFQPRQQHQHDVLLRQLQDSFPQYPIGPAAAGCGHFVPRLMTEKHQQR